MDPSGRGGFDLSANTTGDISGSANTSITAIEIQCGIPVQVAYESSDNPTNWVEFIFYPILLLLCTVGNILNLLVLGTDRNKTTTSVFLICLALSDLCILWLYLPIYIPKVNPAVMDNANYVDAYANFGGAQAWLSEACIQFSDWTLIAFSVERFIAVSNPLGRLYKYKMGRQICTTAIIELGLLILALAATVENAATWYYILVKGNDNSENPAWLHNWKNVQLQFETGITIAKLFVLFILNLAIFIVIMRRYRDRKTVLHGRGSNRTVIRRSTVTGPTKVNDSDQAQRRTSFLFLAACVSLYFIFQFPNVVWKCLELASREPFCTYRFTPEAKQASRPFMLISVLANYSLNFIFYCTICKKFRTQVREFWVRVRGETPDFRRGSTGTVLTDIGSSVNSSNKVARLSDAQAINVLRGIISADEKADPINTKPNEPVMSRTDFVTVNKNL